MVANLSQAGPLGNYAPLTTSGRRNNIEQRTLPPIKAIALVLLDINGFEKPKPQRRHPLIKAFLAFSTRTTIMNHSVVLAQWHFAPIDVQR